MCGSLRPSYGRFQSPVKGSKSSVVAVASALSGRVVRAALCFTAVCTLLFGNVSVLYLRSKQHHLSSLFFKFLVTTRRCIFMCVDSPALVRLLRLRLVCKPGVVFTFWILNFSRIRVLAVHCEGHS